MKINIFIFGESGTGKTSFIKQLVNRNIFNQNDPTIGCIIYGHNYKSNILQLWDVSIVKDKFHTFEHNYSKANAAIFFYDITNKESFSYMLKIYNEFIKVRGYNLPIAFVGNKIDLINGQIVLHENEKTNYKYFNMSVKLNKNINDPIDWIISEIKK